MDLSFLKKKELGLPLWAWALIVSVLMYLLYRHYKNAGGSANSQAPVDTTSQDTPATSNAGDLGGGSGGGLGGAADTSGGMSDLAKVLAPEGAYYQSLLDGIQNDATDSSGNGTDPGANTAPTPTASEKGLEWDGNTFKSRADFNAYLKSKGLSVKQFSARHPAAYGIYLALPTGAPTRKGGFRSGLSKTITPRFQTFRKNVRTTAGQTVHFSSGHGYYAAPGIPHPANSRSGISSPATRQPVNPRFFTYKSQVRLGRGQKLHYKRGRGYYA